MRAALHISWLSLAFACAAVPVLGQQWHTATAAEMKAHLQKSERLYSDRTQMKLTTRISAFTQTGTVVPGSTGSSTVWRMGDRYKAEHLGFTTYQDRKLKILIDPEHRVIYLDKPDAVFTVGQASLQDTLLRQALHITRSDQADGTHFRLTFMPPTAYETTELVFDAAGWLRRMEMLMRRSVALDPADPGTTMVQPRLVIAMDVPVVIREGSVDIDPGQVVGWRDGRPVGLGAWRDYTVFDTRVQ